MAIAHVHDHAEVRYDRAFAVGVTLNSVFVVVEIVSGFLTGSLALLADAGHNLSDVLALTLALAACGAPAPTTSTTTSG